MKDRKKELLDRLVFATTKEELDFIANKLELLNRAEKAEKTEK